MFGVTCRCVPDEFTDMIYQLSSYDLSIKPYSDIAQTLNLKNIFLFLLLFLLLFCHSMLISPIKINTISNINNQYNYNDIFQPPFSIHACKSPIMIQNAIYQIQTRNIKAPPATLMIINSILRVKQQTAKLKHCYKTVV